MVGAFMTRASNSLSGGSSESGSSEVSHRLSISLVMRSVRSTELRYRTWSSSGRTMLYFSSPILVMKLAVLKT